MNDKSMEIIKTKIPDLLIIKPNVYKDERGYFFESYSKGKFLNQGIDKNFVQDNESKSAKGVLRGLHFQKPPYAQSKLVRVVEGRVLDVAVDIRQASPTFGQYVSAELSSDNKYQLFVPRGFAHAFVVLSDRAIFSYKVDNYYSPDCDRGLAFDDLNLNIDWILSKEQLILSDKDKKQPSFVDLETCFQYGTNYYA